MPVAVERIGADGALVTVDGLLDWDATQELERALGEAIYGGATRVAVDLSDVGTFDDAAVGGLFRALREVRAREGALALCLTDARIRSAFEAMGLDRFIGLDETREGALRAAGIDAA